MNLFVKNEHIKESIILENIDGVNVVDDMLDADYIIDGKYTHKDYNKRLKGIIIPYTGHNGIDLEALRDKNLMLFITSTRSKYVAEKALNLSLSLLGNTINYHKLLRNGNWSSRNSTKRVPWTSIQGMKIGLFGYGRIGRRLHSLMKGFDCSFYTIDRQKAYPSDIILVRNIDELIENSKLIVISTPLNSSTLGIFNKERLSKMSEKYLVNVGRGKICDEEALYNALKSNNLRGYASDVWYNYPKGKELTKPSTYPIYDLENVVLSNHSGGFTLNTNIEVNSDIINLLRKLCSDNYEDKLDINNLL